MSEDSSLQTGEPRTLVELLQTRALQEPEHEIYTFLSGDQEEIARLSFSGLDHRARAIAALLQINGVGEEPVLLLFPPGLDFISAFFGCLYAGAVAVPAYPPHSSWSLPRLLAIIMNARPRVILIQRSLRSRMERWFEQSPELERLRWLDVDGITLDAAEKWRDPMVASNDLALLQYTSGSTAAPKGVMLSHDNLIHNQKLIKEAFHQTRESIVVGWLPLYHDMGLIGNVLQPLFTGSRCILMSPMDFLQKPIRWLESISRYQATTSGGPNFAYELCLRKIRFEQCKNLDLSRWEVAFNGAEPVRQETLKRFAEFFEPFGFRYEAFYPCYGLAEATLLVTGGHIRSVQNQTASSSSNMHPVRPLASCGQVFDSEEVVVVDTESLRECQPGQVGEIWVASPSVAQGYWDCPQETEITFRAYLNDKTKGPFLRTGDLGLLDGNDLFVVSRLKDLIIIRGRNLYPQDIEITVQNSHPSLPLDCGAAFSVDRAKEEQLIVIQEVKHPSEIDADSIMMAARRAVAQEHEVHLYEIILIRPGTIPRTTSGKIQRHVCRNLYLSGDLNVISRSKLSGVLTESPETSITRQALMAIGLQERLFVLEAYLKELVTHALNSAPIILDVDQPLASLGIDSLMAIEINHSLEQQLDIVLPVASLLQHGGIAAIAKEILNRITASTNWVVEVESSDKDSSEYALSHNQRSIWFLQRLNPESGIYNLAAAARIRGVLDDVALRAAFQALIDRHPSLRTTIDTRDGEPLQRVHERMSVRFIMEDASGWDDDFLNERLCDSAYRSFDLARDSLLRVVLYRRSPDEHIVLLVAHHMVADFWSLEVLVREMASFYSYFKNGGDEGSAILQPLTAHYRDYVAWLERMLASADGDKHWEYWRKQLCHDLPDLHLPSDRPRPAIQSFRGAAKTLRLGAEISDRIKELSRLHGVTSYMTLLAAFYVLLHRYTGQQDLLVGSPINIRNTTKLTGVVGYFVNTVVLRANPFGSLTFREFLIHVRQMVIEAFEHQDYPFTLLVERLQPERNASRSSLFQAMFVFEKAALPEMRDLAAFAMGEHGSRLELEGLVLESMKLEQRLTQFDLTLMMAESNEGIIGSLQYNRDLFDPATAMRMAEHFENLLKSIADDPERSLSDLQLMSETERQQLLVEWNDTRIPHSRDECIHEMFEAQVERTPNAVAVIFEQERLTYSELNRRANRLAHYLRARGAGPEITIGICLGRSIEMLVGILATLKSGGAYVPLDPAYPKDRIAFMLEDAQIALLLTEAHLVNEFSAGRHQSICFDTDFKSIAEQIEVNPDRVALPENLAYVIYTSGSTGRPKGVAIEHRSTVALLNWAREVFTAEDRSGVLASTSICFDLSVFELFAPLTSGGKLILVESLLELPSLREAQEVKLINTVPSVIAELVRSGGLPDSVRTINLAGEPIKRSLVDQVYARATVEQVFNLYGPSEDTTYSTFELIAKQDNRAPLIGRPIANTQAYLLDACMQPVPLGVAGELYLGGNGVARGYVNWPEQTAERFIPNPFSDEAGSRLYRTGDLARYMPDGSLEFLGRIDHQVKIRGFRIELKEIEATLGKHPAVKDVVVIAREDRSGDQRLVAYIVSGQEPPPAVPQLLDHLQDKLPNFMLPAAFVFLAELPLTANGKVDRNAFPAPDWARPELSQCHAAPRTPVEEVLAAIWAGLLGVEQVGIYDNFFDLGGHSLLAARLIFRVREAFQVELPLLSIFEQPTVAGLARRIEAASRVIPVQPIQPVSRDNPLPLSFAQQRLWFLDQMGSDTAVYNIPVAISLAGTLNLAALEEGLNEIVRRHEALRTTFIVCDGQPMQVISAPTRVTLPVVDISEVPEAEIETVKERLAREEGQQLFNLARGPLYRISVLKLDEENHVLLFTLHHIISDGWSLNIFLRELAIFYENFSDGNSSFLPEAPFQYADYAVWEKQWLEGEVLEDQLAYWKRQLEGRPPIFELPADRPRPAVQTFRGAIQHLPLGESLSSKLKVLGRHLGVTPFMTLLAAFYGLLYRYTGQQDILVGTPVANRNRSEVEQIIGCFVNTLVLRVSLSGDLTFNELLTRVREVSLGAYAHQELPFERLVEELQLERDSSHNPLFQVMFSLQDEAIEVRMPGLSLNVLALDYEVAKCDLTLIMRRNEQGFIAGIEYNADLFDSTTIIRMQGHLKSLLEEIVAKPDQRISTLTLLSREELRQLLWEYNDTEAEYPKVNSIQQLFEVQVERAPEAIALVLESSRLTYRELNIRSNQLAHYLRKLGVGPGIIVGICLDRSLEMIVGLLGVLKAGGAYVPLDPSYPTERLAFMLEDSQVAILLSDEKLMDRLPEHNKRIVRLDADWEIIARENEENPVNRTRPGDLAYVIYTSGTTGKPKGVMITHHSICNRLFWGEANCPSSGADRVLQLASFSFDVSVWEVFMALTSGAQLVLAQPEDHQDVAYLVKLIEDQEITIAGFVPSMLRLILREMEFGNCNSLRHVFCGGEALTPELQEQFFASLSADLHNLYGPTEASIDATYWHCERGADQRAVPIGRPIANTQVYILDAHLWLVPVGVQGELYIGGDCLAIGYFNRPEMTAEKFIPCPFTSKPGARLYRTGDLARYMPDGCIEFLGRVDYQVKIRGLRIESEEIEAVLCQLPDVREAVVICEGQTGNERLTAYVVPHRQQDATISRLRSSLRAKLPQYMVPSAFVMLEELPLTSTGKIDRRALAKLDLNQVVEEDFIAPRTPVEEVLASIWAEVLRIERISIYSNFFDLGGHSLLATQVVSRLRQAFHIEFPLVNLFQDSTIAGMAHKVEAALRLKQGRLQPPLRPIARSGNLPLSFSQQRLWFLDLLKSESHFYNISAAIRMLGSLNVWALERSVNEVIRRHEALRASFDSSNGIPIQAIASELSLTIPVVDLRQLGSDEREKRIMEIAAEEARHPFDLRRPPLLRVKLIQEDEQAHVLLLVIHHIISDAWSFAIFTAELSQLYEAFCEGKSSPLPELSIQYADFAIWQRQWLQGEALNAQLKYWKKQLAGIPSMLNLPTDRRRPPVQSFRGATQSFALSADLSESLKALSRRESVTLFMTLLSGFVTLLHRYSAQEDIVIGTDIANRTQVEIEGLIGFFINTLVLRVRLSGDTVFRDLLADVRDVTLDAYAHQDLPFHEVVKILQPERDLSINPLFQVMFIFQNAPEVSLNLQGFTLTPLSLEDKTSVFDLSVSMEEAHGIIRGTVRYSADLFDAGTITRLVERFETLLQNVVAQPDARLSALEIMTESETQTRAAEKKKHRDLKFEKLMAVKPKAVAQFQKEMVKTGYLQPDMTLPCVVQPAGGDVDLLAWASNNRESIEAILFKHGAVLFRNFKPNSLERFEGFARIISGRLIEYSERSSPRTLLGGFIYTSTDHPADQSILLHNEQSYTLNWPMKISFYCIQPAERGGNTPIADSRKILGRINMRIVEKFAQKHVMYVRNYGDGLGLPWQEVFQTDNKFEVEEHCRRASIEVEWKDNNRLRTRQIRPAIRKHPKTGEAVWFNHALFFHISSLNPELVESFTRGLKEEDLPYNVLHGDGSPIEQSMLDQIREAYQQETVSFTWKRGDILMLDNMLVAHGREPFDGPRKIAVVMADPFDEKAALSMKG